MKRQSGWIWGMMLWILFWAIPSWAEEVAIAAASDLNYAFKEMIPLFEKESGVTVKLSLGSSGNFYAQIENGAPFDLFFSADIQYPKKLEEAGLAVPGTLYQYAIGRIVIWTPKESPIDVERTGMKALLEPSVRKIAIANPKHAPYGRAAVEAMEHFNVHDAVKDKLVLGENVSQAAQFVASGAADLGIIALSLALGPTMKEQGRYWEVPEEAHQPLAQGAILLKRGSSSKGARAFLLFLQGSEGRAIMEKYGFQLPSGGSTPSTEPRRAVMNWQAVWVTLRLATVTSIILLVIGLPIAYWLAFSRWRWKFLMESVVALPLVLPPTVLGFYVLVAIGPRSPLGAWYEQIVGHPLPFTFQGLVVASVLYSLPFVVQPVAAAFAGVDRRLIEASWTLGISPWVTFFRVILPLSLTGLITGAVLGFAHTMGEFGVVLMVGGNIEGVTRTVSIDIYDEVQALNYSQAAETSLALLIFSFLILSIIYAINKKRRQGMWTAPIESSSK